MASFPVNGVPVEFNNEYYDLTGNMLVINLGDDFNDTMRRYLVSLLFSIYVEVDGEYIYVDNSTVTWSDKTDKAIILDFPYPEGSVMTVKAVVDKDVFNLVDLEGNLLYPNAKDITEFPIVITNS